MKAFSVHNDSCGALIRRKLWSPDGEVDLRYFKADLSAGM